MKGIVFTVTNDLSYDQRMIRICSSLSSAGYQVTLIGCKNKRSVALAPQTFRQKRLFCFFNSGKLFYAEFNFRLFFSLLFHKADVIGAIDLDTILPCYFVSKLRSKQRLYDAHELFCEMKEIVSRPFIYKCWKWVERFTIPKFQNGYTVNQQIADEFEKMYGVKYAVIRNMPVYRNSSVPEKREKYLLYQGAVNEGRSFETLIPAMQMVDAQLLICGDGNFMSQAKELARKYQVEDKLIFKGKMLPEDLRKITQAAWAGITLFDAAGKSNYFSLANRFFDYIQAGIPQLCVDFPLYREINNKHSIAVLTDKLDADSIAQKLNELLSNSELYRQIQNNCLSARTILCWQEEEKKLLAFYNTFD